MSIRTLLRKDGSSVKLGRKPQGQHHPPLSFGQYLSKKAPILKTPPASVDYTPAAVESLSKMYLNDRLGDCVVVAVQHVQGVLTGNANPPPLILTDSQTKSLYSSACGYVDGNSSTDQGCEIQTVLSYWQKNGQPLGSNHKIAGYLSVDPTNLEQCKLALWLFGNLIFGINMPANWVNPIPSRDGFVWGIGGEPVQNNGHCFPAFGYDENGFKVSTWGLLGTMTHAATQKYGVSRAGGEVWVVVSQDQLNIASQKAPNGFDWDSLVADFRALGGTVTDPTPLPPVTPPPPTPKPPVTPPVTPTPLVPGSKAWMQANLSPAAYAAYVAAVQKASYSTLPGTPYWLKSRLTYSSWMQFASAFSAGRGLHIQDITKDICELYNNIVKYLKAKYLD
jgi:hypothetical protein